MAETADARESGPAERTPQPAGGRRRRRGAGGTPALLSGPMLYLGMFFLVPVLMVAAHSVGLITLLPQDRYLSLDGWRYFVDSIWLGVFWKSVRISLAVSVTAVVLAYPLAYFLAIVAGRRKYVLLLVVITPFLTSYLLRVLAWRVILGEQGVINSLLFTMGIRDPGEPLSWLIYTQFTVYLVLAYVWVPFVALPIFVTLDGLDRALLEASTDLGASRWTTFRKVTLPMSLPGVVAAFVFVFIPTLGEYVTPMLVGGPDGFMFGNAIETAFSGAFDWQLGSVMAMFLVGVVMVLLLVFGRFVNPRTVAAER